MFKKICVIIFCLFFLIQPCRIIDASEKKSGYAFFPPNIDGTYDLYNWNEALSLSFDFGKVLISNNKENLFVFIDFIKDFGNDNASSLPRCEDYFEFALDWDGNQKISPGLDRIYTLCKNEANRIIYRYYLGRSSFSEVYFSQGKGTSGFGVTPNNAIPHRIYEFSLPLTEVKKDDLKEIYFGVKVVSKTPSLYFENPKNFNQDLMGAYRITINPMARIILLSYLVGSRNMTVNGTFYQMDTEPMIYFRRSFLPVRFVIEPLGGIFQWNSFEQRLVIMIKDLLIEMKVNHPYATVNGKKILIETFNHSITPLLIPPGRVFVPLRFLSDTIGGKTTWDAKKQNIKIEYKVT